jgi:transcriptional regulator with XRE-family HTH domain
MVNIPLRLLCQSDRNMQARLNLDMNSREAQTLGQRLNLARRKRGLSQQQLTKLSGVSQSDLSKLERGTMQKTSGIARLADALAVPSQWLELGFGSEPNWEIVLHSSGRVAHGLSDPVPIVSPTTLRWEELMTEDLPSTFAMQLRDDAMAPLFVKGGVVRFSTSKTPAPGKYVLLADRDGNTYFREYRATRGAQWQASALNPSYQPLDSERDGLTVLAVATGWDLPD